MYSNHLISESSPYLLQHAHNPVNWHPWSENIFELAQIENKLILVSIGYSACHWCHVMEHESFEDEEVATLMNSNFICVKVDREERPDIDMLYMQATQMLTGQGGWPLNCIALPDGRPIYGGTYFPKVSWMYILQQLISLQKNEPNRILQQANQLEEGIRKSQLIHLDFTIKSTVDFKNLFSYLQPNFDRINGGFGTSPKFPMPVVFDFLLNYYFYYKAESSLNFVVLSLKKIIAGGIYDQLGGGFARYSTDDEWFAPHFEKMLYDNAQLVHLLSQAYKITNDIQFLNCIEETIHFLNIELKNGNGLYYSALDADSEGLEGKYYTFSFHEIKTISENNAEAFILHYGITPGGNWEVDRNILHIALSFEEVAVRLNTNVEQVIAQINETKKQLFQYRETRIRPGTDNKIITSWNALLLKALTQVYSSTGNEIYVLKAIKIGEELWLSRKQNNTLFRIYNEKTKIEGFLDDYACYIEACFELFKCTANAEWLIRADEVLLLTLKLFFDDNSGYFFFEPSSQAAIIARKMDFNDNVIPSANSIMGHNLLNASVLLGKSQYREMAQNMVSGLAIEIEKHPMQYANWASLALKLQNHFFELIIAGDGYNEALKQQLKTFSPNMVIAATGSTSDLAIFKDRYKPNETLFYLCRNNVCDLPERNFNIVAKKMKV